jgi:protein O-GlcNAc transferase
VAKKNKKSKHSVIGHKIKKKPFPRPAGAYSMQKILQQAVAFYHSGHMPQAEALFRRILQVEPDHVVALHYLGILAYAAGKWEIAAELMKRVLTLKPDFAEAHYNLGNALDELGKQDRAVACYRRAILLRPDYVEAHYNLGLLLQVQGKPDEAAASYRLALSLKPDYVEAHNNLGIALKDQGKLSEAINSFRQALTLRPDYAEAHSNLLFFMTYLPGRSSAHYLEEARLFGRQATAKVRARFSDWICSLTSERLRIGLISDDLRKHPVGYFLENMLAHIDTKRIELIAYPITHKMDELTDRIHPHFFAWKPLQDMSDETVSRLIHNDGVHILLDLSGHTSHNRLSVFAWKPAPVQASWLGYFASTGMAEMDYLIADPVSIPETCQANFTEKIWYLPETRICFSQPASDDELPVTPLTAASNGYITFGCFQNLAKLNDVVLAVWGRILHKLPQARLRLQNPQNSSATMRAQLQQRLDQHGIASERVTLEKPVSRMDYLAAHANIDIILDTFPFSGCTTTCEALWMGVPTVTLAGETMVSRQGASLLTCSGLSDWIALDEEDYITKAVVHASDMEKLARLRSNLRQQVLASPLFDGRKFATNFETAMWEMWQQFRENQEAGIG